ncbi:MAG: riboflavin biosynthesis protein RibF [Oscillibacter sp.]|nr:riboflavin biosynthesis protein RibF [Oscillibacter sp.]
MSQEEKVIALGFLDGVHLGHGALLRRTVEEAKRRGIASALFTFDRPPKEVVTGRPCPLINSQEDRAGLVRRLYGVEQVIIAPFNAEMMATTWETFVTDILYKHLRAAHLVAGHDHRFGYRNAGNPELLREKCRELGMGCDIIPKVTLDGVTVSSTYIRQLLAAGDAETAERFLGHPHTLTQEVRHGRRVGRTIGAPTVNMTLPPHVMSPAHGVYATVAVLPDDTRRIAVTNVGRRPTLDNGDDVTVESWILDFDGDLYGRPVRIEFRRRLRGEIRFPSLDALRAQIAADADAARAWFQEHPEVSKNP